MSGSPLISQYVGFYQHEPDHISGEDWFGSSRNLLGVYSGRDLGKTEYEAQLGIVWKASVIKTIVDEGVRPS